MNMGGTCRGADEFPGDIYATIRRLERIVKGERARGVEKVAVVGMSQGGAVATSMYMVSNMRLDGVVGLSAWLPDSMAGANTAAPVNAALPLLMVHGSADDVIELGWNQAMIAVMRERGRVVESKVIDGAGHAFGKDVFTALKYTFGYLKHQGL
jgi:uncharacterized protein